ncbi:long-chain-acyl-CoA dehydrogenase [Actinoplanes lutulentus]|uniref:Acyl-[acyl-carrier-protein] dehydrogenase MbtN n=1 Tax=Actinoplanes lutulentus TaxID=1287878 RepID=A0A327Z404_9ACTN|nr:acyl-CoA dehydrogenase family protein [Actinoplanes lutulentus]MBB2946975.1 long-chain-acyl-CoA dehydrogenase [Actinoplanes lutulentus]RAK30477.1 long-chain-acyl-CoA dehydrogenase [Actinoplanes lutulentus]
MTDLYERRSLFDDEHEAFRDSVKAFVAREVAANVDDWEEAADIPRDIWLLAGQLGYLGLPVPEDCGGSAITDYRFRMAMIEETARAGANSLAAGFAAQTDVVLPYFIDLAAGEQRKRWLPKLASGEWIGAIAMTEPGTGSDLKGIRATAVRDGDGWLLNGSKTFITNGINADLVIVVARTGEGAFSLFVVENGTTGFTRGRKLRKLGLKAQDTAELHFDDVRLDAGALLGEEGRGLHALMSHLPLERLNIAVTACAGARAALAWTIDYVRDRRAFGKQLAEFQNTQFAVAEMVTELEVTQAYVDDAVLRFNRDELSAVDAAKAKWWATEMHKRLVDRCLQLHGGYGYMLEYPIARAYADTRVTTIYGGTTEIMKLIIARDVLETR